MKYFLIAGEASGDLHASHLIESLKQLDAQAEFRFLGGDLMAAQAGVEPIIHYRDMAYMGFADVVKHLGKILGFLGTARRAIDEWQPAALVLVDYPSFNLKVAKYAHNLGIPVHYFISPKVWVWKEWRVKDIRRYVDHMYCILPFESDWYRERGYKATYVGNPTVQEVADASKETGTASEVIRRPMWETPLFRKWPMRARTSPILPVSLPRTAFPTVPSSPLCRVHACVKSATTCP